MRFTVRATEAAILDQIEAAAWYEEQQEGLGRRFISAVASTARTLEQGALIHSMRFRDVRRVAVQQFGVYGLFYVTKVQDVTIFAVLHGARSPSWIRRRRSGFNPG